MNPAVLFLAGMAVTAYFLVLATHSLRQRFGLVAFYALLGALTAVMSWVTDAGVAVQAWDVTFLTGSTVFYTSLLLGVFVVYVFDGPQATRVAILTVAGVSALTPLLAGVLHWQASLAGALPLNFIPEPSFRINAASVVTTMADMLFLAMAWEFMGKRRFRLPLWLRSYLTLLSVMWFDVILFTTLAFGGSPEHLQIMAGTLFSRFVISIFAFPFLYGYLHWQNRRRGSQIVERPVLAILQEFDELHAELVNAQIEIERRRRAEQEQERLIGELSKALQEVKTLRGLLPTCAHCYKIRDENDEWQRLEHYIRSHSEADFTHGICPDCMAKHYPEVAQYRDKE